MKLFGQEIRLGIGSTSDVMKANDTMVTLEFGTEVKYKGGIIPYRPFMQIGEGGGEAVIPKVKARPFVKCDYCGSLYPKFQTNCVNCGAPLPGPREVLRYPRGDGLGYMEFPLRPAIRRSRIL